MNGRKAKQRRRLEEQRKRTANALDGAMQAASAINVEDQRVIIVEGTMHDDVLVVPKTSEEQELSDARIAFAAMYGGEEIKSMVRMVGRSEPEGKERQA